MDYINIEFGPFVGISDIHEKPDFGITGSIDLTLPGIVFFSINGSSSIGSNLEFMGNNNRETGEIKLGFWAPYIVAAFSINTKSLTRQLENSLELRDELIRFQFSADFHAKNFPLILRIDAGYEILSRSYKLENSEKIDELGAVFGGIEAKFQVLRQMHIIAGMEVPLHYNAKAPMESPANIFSLYKIKAGVSYTFF